MGHEDEDELLPRRVEVRREDLPPGLHSAYDELTAAAMAYRMEAERLSRARHHTLFVNGGLWLVVALNFVVAATGLVLRGG